MRTQAIGSWNIPRGTLSRASVTALALAGAPALAEPIAASSASADTLSLEETVIVASRFPTPLSRTGVSVTVVDRVAIEALAYPDLLDLLDAQVGVNVTQTGGIGGVANVRIRGEEGFRTRIVLDGIDIADPSSPQISPRFEQLLTAGIERVEILRGPQGLLWGADAGGVIALSSRAPSDGFTGELRNERGSLGFDLWSLHAAGGSDRLSASASINRLDSDGINARSDDTELADRDGYRNRSGHGTAQLVLNERWSVQGTLHDVSGDNAYDACFDNATFASTNRCRDRYDQQAWRLALLETGDTSQHTLAFSDSQIDRLFFSNGEQGFTAEGRTQQASANGGMALDSKLRLGYGIEQVRQSFDDGFSARRRDAVGAYGELFLPLKAGSVSVGIRHDDNEDFGHFTSWRATFVHDVALGDQPITLRAATGTGFRAPSLYEIAYNASSNAFPPASGVQLTAERSSGSELAAGTMIGNAQIELVAFAQQIENEIFFDLGGFSGYLQGDGEATSRGLEAVVKVALTAQLSLEANATHNRTEDNSGRARAFRPENTARMTIAWTDARWTAGLTARGAWERVDIDGAPMEDFWLIDAVWQVPLSEQLTLTLRGENLTDSDYQYIAPFNTPGRTLYVAAAYRW